MNSCLQRSELYADKLGVLLEMDSGTAFLAEVSGHKHKSSQTRVLSGFLPSFSVVQNAIHE